jgi:hypothetical protein
MIKLEINALELTEVQLVHTATFLMALAGHSLVAPPENVKLPEVVQPSSGVRPVPLPDVPVHNATPLSVPPVIKNDIESRIEKAFNLPEGSAALESVTTRDIPIVKNLTIDSEGFVSIEGDATISGQLSPATPPENTKPVQTAELDVEGMPWDARIHSRTKSKYANGTWKIKREVPPALVAQVKKELAQVMSAPKPKGSPFPPGKYVVTESGEVTIEQDFLSPELDSAPALPPRVDKPSIPKPPAPPRPPVTAVTVTPQQAQEHLDTLADDPNEPTDFVGFMELVTAPVADGRLPQATLVQIIQAHGVPSVPLVAHRPDLIPGICEAIKNYLAEA